MKHDRTRAASVRNWLLIKHRDEAARDGDGDAVLADDRSVASGRPMAKIAAGKGRGAKPFLLRGVKDRWRADAAHGIAPVRPCPISCRRSSAASMARPPSGAGWVHEIKFDGYRMQLRVAGGRRR